MANIRIFFSTDQIWSACLHVFLDVRIDLWSVDELCQMSEGSSVDLTMCKLHIYTYMKMKLISHGGRTVTEEVVFVPENYGHSFQLIFGKLYDFRRSLIANAVRHHSILDLKI